MPSRARRRRRGSRVRWFVLGGVAALAAWIVVSGVVVWGARTSTDAGLQDLTRARASIGHGGLLDARAAHALSDAKRDFADAHSETGGVLVAPWRVVPLLGDNFSSVAQLGAAAEHVSEITARAASRAQELLGQHPTSGADRLAMLGDLAKITRRAERALRDVDLGPDFFLVSPLRDARTRFARHYDELRRSFANTTAAAEGTERLLRGPRRYLVLVANDSEMRAGSGMFVSAGVATFAAGEITLGVMRPASELGLPAGAVSPPAELERLWGSAPLGRDWGWLATTPRFDVSAELAARMWRAVTGERVDGVLALDPVAVRALLRAQGPIEVDGQRLTSDNVVDYLLLQQYLLIDPSNPLGLGSRDGLHRVTSAIVDMLMTRAWNPDHLVRELAVATQGRHVMAWARRPSEERLWADAGMDGGLGRGSLAVSILNTGGNKLDPYVAVTGRLRVSPRTDGRHAAVVDLRIANRAPAGTPAAVGGPTPGTDLTAGEYQGVVVVSTPGVGSRPELEGRTRRLARGRDGPTEVVVAGPLRVRAGTTAHVTVRFTLPAGLDRLVVEPSARVPPVAWRSGRRQWHDTASHVVALGATSLMADGESSSLPFTGGDAALVTLLGLGAVGAGVAIVMLSRRRITGA